MLLQIALDKPEHLSILPFVNDIADIIEIGTPLLKRFGIGLVSTVKEICPEPKILTDTKTVDGGLFEAEMVFEAGASFMTVLSCASVATREAVDKCALEHGCFVIIDTITETGEPMLLANQNTLPSSFKYVAVHSPTDMRLAGHESACFIEAVKNMHERGFRVSLAGGMGPDSIDAVIEANPDILVVGSAITESKEPRESAKWLKTKMPNPGLGWPLG